MCVCVFVIYMTKLLYSYFKSFTVRVRYTCESRGKSHPCACNHIYVCILRNSIEYCGYIVLVELRRPTLRSRIFHLRGRGESGGGVIYLLEINTYNAVFHLYPSTSTRYGQNAVRALRV